MIEVTIDRDLLETMVNSITEAISQELVINAKKDWGHVNSVYNISCEEKYYARSGRYYAGYLKGNFGGTRFNLFSCHD